MDLENITVGSNFKEICRLCMGKEPNLLPLFVEDDNVSERIMNLIPSLKLSKKDGLPSQVCSQCVQKVHECHNFKKQCESSDTALRKLLNLRHSQDGNSVMPTVKQEPDTDMTIEVEPLNFDSSDESRLKFLRSEELCKILEVYSDKFAEFVESDNDLEEENIEASEHDSESEQECSDNDCEIDDSSECFVGKDKTTKWAKNVCVKNSKTRQKNIVKFLPGPTSHGRDMRNEIDAFLKIIDLDIIDEIVSCTNINIEKKRTIFSYSRERENKITSRSEIMAVLGILFLIGIKKGHHTDVRELWATDGTGTQILRAAMSYKRFLFLLRSIRFDDLETRNERKITDKLAAIRKVMDAFIENCKKAYCLSEFVTIDEMLHPFRGRCEWIQYIPSKPVKYGLKMFVLCDAKTFYCSNLEVYCGKQPPGEYQVSNSPQDVVKRLVVPIENSNRNLTTDNWYSSLPLAEYLLEKKISFLGTLKKDKEEIPPEMLPDKKKEVGSSIFGFQKNKTLVSFVPRKNRSVILLSTMHDSKAIDNKTKKPKIILDYNNTKDGVNTLEKMCAFYSVSRITKRWPLALFFSFLNIAAINSYIIFSFNKQEEKIRRIMYLKNLALGLMKDHLIYRADIHSLPADVSAFLTKYQPVKRKIKEEEVSGPPAKKRGSCFVCGRKKNSSTSIKCDKCQKFACKLHTKRQITCESCA